MFVGAGNELETTRNTSVPSLGIKIAVFSLHFIFPLLYHINIEKKQAGEKYNVTLVITLGTVGKYF